MQYDTMLDYGTVDFSLQLYQSPTYPYGAAVD